MFCLFLSHHYTEFWLSFCSLQFLCKRQRPKFRQHLHSFRVFWNVACCALSCTKCPTECVFHRGPALITKHKCYFLSWHFFYQTNNLKKKTKSQAAQIVCDGLAEDDAQRPVIYAHWGLSAFTEQSISLGSASTIVSSVKARSSRSSVTGWGNFSFLKADFGLTSSLFCWSSEESLNGSLENEGLFSWIEVLCCSFDDTIFSSETSLLLAWDLSSWMWTLSSSSSSSDCDCWWLSRCFWLLLLPWLHSCCMYDLQTPMRSSISGRKSVTTAVEHFCSAKYRQCSVVSYALWNQKRNHQ